MRLVSARVENYKSIANSGDVGIEADVTTLVGKNESGKSAFLEALYRINPVTSGLRAEFDELRDYPRRRRAADRARIGNFQPIHAVFELEDDDIRAVEGQYGSGVLPNTTIIVSKNYSNGRIWSFPVSEAAAVGRFANHADLAESFTEGVTTLQALRAKLDEAEERTEPANELLARLEDFDLHAEIRGMLIPRLPKFLYFGEYSTLPGRFSIPFLQNTPETQFDTGERTALALLRLAGVDSQEFAETEYEARRAALEAAANEITDEVFEFWSQNDSLRVDFDADFTAPPEPGHPSTRTAPFLDIRIWNDRHRVSLNFSERSTGFVWFFSFLSYFSEFRNQDESLILLLDEPGMGLHAAAQGDLLRFIDERLASDHQVIYTTHSPFMVNPTKLDKARTVEDKDGEGTKISAEVLSVSRDTLFPLQASLGYHITQTLFVGEDNLVVEGPADILYLQIVSNHLRDEGRTALDPRWVIVPVGGVDKIPTFIALLGTQLNIAVLLDVAAGGNPRIDSMVTRRILERNKVFPLTQITGGNEADIEDLFDPGFYLEILRGAGVANLRVRDLPPGPRLLKRIEDHLGNRFNHYQPAAYFQRDQSRLVNNSPYALT